MGGWVGGWGAGKEDNLPFSTALSPASGPTGGPLPPPGTPAQRNDCADVRELWAGSVDEQRPTRLGDSDDTAYRTFLARAMLIAWLLQVRIAFFLELLYQARVKAAKKSFKGFMNAIKSHINFWTMIAYLTVW